VLESVPLIIIGVWPPEVAETAFIAVTKGMQTVKLCTNKILQFVTGGAG